MNIIINSSSMIPIYEQIVDQIKGMILNSTLKENDILPSVRSLSKDLKISALTVKKAYDCLEQEGLTVTIHGKGTFVAVANRELMREEQRKKWKPILNWPFRKADVSECRSRNFGRF